MQIALVSVGSALGGLTRWGVHAAFARWLGSHYPVGTFVVLKVLAGMTTVSIFSLNLTTALGLGLAIDYSLFIVSRYREERARGREPREAVVATVATAGRSVVFSGLTVAISLAALLVFPIAFLKSFAYAGIPVVAAVGAPSSLAIDLAQRTGILLVGFLRGHSFNVYSHRERLQ